MGSTPQPAPAQSSGGLEPNIAGLLCYSPIGLICDIIWLVADPYKNNKFIRFHAFQSLFLCGACFALGIAFGIMNVIVAMAIGPLVAVLGLLELVLWFGIFGLCIFMMVKCYQNETIKLPVIGPMAAKQAGM